MRQKILIGLFLAMVFGLSIWGLLKPDTEYSEKENRYLQQTPDPTVSDVLSGRFSTEYETYVTDQFPGRDSWIRVRCLAEVAVGKKDTSGVYFAKDHTLIAKHDASEFTDKQAAKNAKKLETFLAAHANARAMIVPTAEAVLTEKLPSFAVPFDEISWIRGLGLTNLVDVSDTLKSHAGEYIYYGTDHHWTTLGAYYAYAEWAQSIGITPHALSDFDQEVLSDSFYGTTDAKVNLPVQADTITGFNLKDGTTYDIIYDEKQETETDSIYSRSHLSVRDKYAVFLDGNHGMTKITTNVTNGKTLLIIKDSYAHCLAPMAASHYTTTYMIDLRYYTGSVKKLLADTNPDDILVLYNAAGFAQDTNVFKIDK